MARQCAFCSQIANLTGEHLWSDWIGKLLGTRKYTFTRIEPDGRELRWEGNELNLKAKVVCENCNSGWMSDLESATKPFLKDMILSCKETALHAKEIALLAAVTFKNTVVADHMHDNRGPFFTARERRDFRYTLIVPDGFQAWMGSIPDQHGVFNSMDFKTKRSNAYSFHLNVFNYAIGHFTVQSLTSRYLRRSDRRHAPQLYTTQANGFDPVSTAFWPSDGSPIVWPPPAHMGHDLFNQFVYRWKNLERGPTWRCFGM